MKLRALERGASQIGTIESGMIELRCVKGGGLQMRTVQICKLKLGSLQRRPLPDARYGISRL